MMNKIPKLSTKARSVIVPWQVILEPEAKEKISNTDLVFLVWS